MDTNQRSLTIVTSLGKRYTGTIDVPNATIRTTDLLNSSNIFWKNPNEKCYDNAILMYDVKLYVDDSAVYKKFEKIQIKISEIFYFYDGFQNIGDEMEKKRADTMIKGIRENAQMVNIITRVVSNSFYDINGLFFGLFKKKSKDKFFPLTQVKMVEILKKQDQWVKKEIKLPHSFIGVSNQHIESVTID
ncbi:MAG: hypothetical protein HF978_02800 [Desulfobacteraceae bacterium]|nr:hypothetical protein [Desulfobacteraceae bacterium]MBC2754453.1 hypothetical protein [Desulfobacteraceae bacterium]